MHTRLLVTLYTSLHVTIKGVQLGMNASLLFCCFLYVHVSKLKGCVFV